MKPAWREGAAFAMTVALFFGACATNVDGAAPATDGGSPLDAGTEVLDATSPSRGDGASALRDGATPRIDSAADAEPLVSACIRAGNHRMSGTVCCAGEGAGSVAELSLCCRSVGGACDTTAPNPDAYCCFPESTCNRATGKCEAHTCWKDIENCRMGPLPCCGAGLVCDPTDAGPLSLSKRCCRPDGEVPSLNSAGNNDCCSTALHTNDRGKLVCGPQP